MPNWCENDLYVCGTEEELKRFHEFAETEGRLIDFNKFIPYPKEFEIADSEKEKVMELVEKGEMTLEKAYETKGGYNSGGYEWCIKNWGTKWNACAVIIKEYTVGKITYRFETAWAPPAKVIDAMADKFPLLEFRLEYFEQGMAFEGKYYRKGDIILKDWYSDKYEGDRGG